MRKTRKTRVQKPQKNDGMHKFIEEVDLLCLGVLEKHARVLKRRADMEPETFRLNYADLRVLKEIRAVAQSLVEQWQEQAESKQQPYTHAGAAKAEAAKADAEQVEKTLALAEEALAGKSPEGDAPASR